MKLSNYLVSRLEAWVPFEDEGFEVKLAHLSREELNKIRQACTKIAFNPKSRVREDTIDSDLFIKEFVKATVLDWRGFTFKVASRLLPIQVPEDVDLATEIPFSQENALDLAKNSSVFDGWLNDVIFDLDSFRTK